MQNLRYKLLFIICALFTSVHLFGVNASDHYTYYTRQFLGNLGVRNPAAVPVRKINRNDPLYGAAGYADGHAIHLNEDTFAGNSEACNLFTCAHEAAHHALGHAFQGHRNIVVIEQEADEAAARMLCTHGYRWIVEEEVRSGRVEDNDHPTNQQRRRYLNAILAAHGGDYNPGRQQAGRERNGGAARNAGRGRDNNAGGARGRNGAGTANAGREGNQGRNAGREQNANRERNNDPVVSQRTGIEELKDLLRSFNNLSREQKLVIAGIVGMSFMGWL